MASPNTGSSALSMMSITVTPGEKTPGAGPTVSLTSMTRPAAPPVLPSPKATQTRLPLVATNVVSVSASEVWSRPASYSTSLRQQRAAAACLTVGPRPSSAVVLAVPYSWSHRTSVSGRASVAGSWITCAESTLKMTYVLTEPVYDAYC